MAGTGNRMDPLTVYSLRKRPNENKWHFSETCPDWPTASFLSINEELLDTKLPRGDAICFSCWNLYFREAWVKASETSPGKFRSS